MFGLFSHQRPFHRLNKTFLLFLLLPCDTGEVKFLDGLIIACTSIDIYLIRLLEPFHSRFLKDTTIMMCDRSQLIKIEWTIKKINIKKEYN